MGLDENSMDFGKDRGQRKRILLMGMRLKNLHGRKEGQEAQEKNQTAAKTSVLKRLHQKQERPGK